MLHPRYPRRQYQSPFLLVLLLLVGLNSIAFSTSSPLAVDANRWSPSTKANEESTSFSNLFGTIGRYWMSKLDAKTVVPALLSSSTTSFLTSDSATSSSNGQLSLRRSLQESDFEDLNKLLKAITVQAPDTTVQQKILWNTLNLDLKNIKCYDISIQDVAVSFQKVSNQKITVPVEIIGLDMWCELNWRYSWGIFHDGGTAQMYTDDNSAKTVLAFKSEGFDQHAPNGSSIESCEPSIRITDINIQGDFVAQVVNFAEKSIRGTVATQIENVLCEELGTLGSSTVSDLIGVVDGMIEEYKGALPQALANPLTAENRLAIPNGVELMDLTDTANSIGGWFDTALKEADAMLGSLTADAGSPTGTGKDLGVNKILRSSLLDKNRAYTVPVSSWPTSISNGGIIFEGHDMLTETTIILNEIRLLGLDTFTLFDPLNSVGRYTLANSFKLDHLTFEVDLTIKMKPSSHSDAIFVDPSGDRQAQIERITVKSGVKNIAVDLSFLLALNQKILGATQLGSILDTSQILPCLLGAIHKATLTGLSVSVEDIDTPTISGFVSKGLDRILRTAADLAFVMYKAQVLDAMPNFFQTTVRNMLNDMLKKQIDASSSDGVCPLYEGTIQNGGILDYRDLFLSRKEASKAGGSGDAPYGDVGPMLMDLMSTQLLSPDENGSSKVNSILIRPMTEAQSGTEGMLRFVSDLLRFSIDDITDLLWSSFAQSMEFKVFDTRLANLDTVRNPTILKPMRRNPIELHNSFAMGDEDSLFRNLDDSGLRRPVTGEIRALVDIKGDTPLAMTNDVNIQVEIPSMEMLANILAPINEKEFMEFPLASLVSLNCWLATIATPQLTEDGFRVSSKDVAMAVSEFVMSLSSVQLDISCVSCTSSGLNILPEVIDTIEEVGTIAEVKDRLVGFADELFEGEWIQSHIDRLLVDAAKKCPHHAAYQEEFTSTDWPPLAFPPVSRDTLELILLSGAVFLQAGVVVVAESHSSAAEQADPLSGQNSLRAPSSARLLDLSDLGASLGALGGFADTAISQVRDQFGRMVNDQTGPNAATTGKDLYVNVLLRDILLDDDRTFSVPLGDARLDTGDLSISLHSLRIRGLDTFTELDLLNAIGKQTIMNRVQLERLDLEVDLAVIDATAAERVLGTTEDHEHVKISIGLEDVDADIALLFALDLNLFGDLELGSILHLDKILPCILSASRAVDLSQLSLSIGSIKEPSITGFISNESELAIRSATKAIFEKYQSTVVEAMPAFFDQTVRPLLNGILSSYVNAESSRSCPTVSTPELSGFVNFHDLLLPEGDAAKSGGRGTSPYGDVFRYLMQIIDEQVLSTDSSGLSNINDVVFRPMTEAQSNVPGSLLFPGDLFGGASNVNVGGFQATVEVRAFDAALENIDSVGEPLKLLEPKKGESSILDNTATFGIEQRPLRGSVGFLLSIMGNDDGLQMRNEIVVSADLSAATLMAEALLHMREQSFLSFPLRDMLDVNCWLATMPAADLNEYGVRSTGAKASLALQELAVTISRLQLNVECISCTSPGFEELAQMLSSPEGVEDATVVANKVSNYITSLLGGAFIDTQIDRLLYNAAKQCPHHEDYDPSYVAPATYKEFDAEDNVGEASPLNFLLALLIVGSLLFVFIAAVSVIVKCIVRRRHRRWIATLSPDEISNVYAQQVGATEIEKALCRRTRSLATSRVIPLFVRVIMPFVILGNIGLFLSGHLSLGATVSIKAEVAGEELVVPDFFKFSMAYSVGEMWNAGAKSLAVLILIFSGVWPYTKQAITLVLWFLPPTRCSTTRRGKILLWLDVMAKWSMVDIFVLLCTLAAFRISIESPDGLAFLPAGFYSINLMVIPLWGLYANMLAQLISQVSSHFIIYYHRREVASVAGPSTESCSDRAQDADKSSAGEDSDNECDSLASPTKERDQSNDDTEPMEALCLHRFQTDFHTKERLGTVRPYANKIVIFGAVVVTTLIITGCTLYSFSLEVMGLVGIAVESGQDFAEAKTNHNLFTLVGVIMEEARFLDTGRYYVGLGTLCALLILTTLIVPIVQVWVLVRQWLAPLSKKRRKRVHVAIECLAAWQYVEVYIISIVITAWQIGGVSDFMVNAYCSDLSGTFSSMAYYGIIDAADAQCFRVEARLEQGVYVLVVAAVFLGLVNNFVCKAAEQRDKEDREAHLKEEAFRRDDSIRSEDIFTDQDDKGVDKASRITPVPVRFTDTYRFLLTLDDESADSIAATSDPGVPPKKAFIAQQITDDIESSEEDIVVQGEEEDMV